MERLQLRRKDAVRALETLESILGEPFSVIVRDATIQRFEYTFEAFWKYLGGHLKEHEGIVANSPKSCFRECFSVGLFDEDETVSCLEMTDRRNDTSHTYKEEVAQAIYEKIGNYSALMKTLLARVTSDSI